MYLIGLTGNIASGKSTVRRMLEDLGARVVDADLLAHYVMRPGKPAWRAVAAEFGPGVLRADGSVDRSALGAVVFSDPLRLARLEKIVHPAVSAELALILRRTKEPVVAVEAGKVKFWTTSPNAGCMLYLYGASGTTYLYIHLNNDLTMQNDNRGKCVPGVSYARGLKNGAKVSAGQMIGYVGDSGDANGIASHLHFRPKTVRTLPVSTTNSQPPTVSACGRTWARESRTTPPRGRCMRTNTSAETACRSRSSPACCRIAPSAWASRRSRVWSASPAAPARRSDDW